MPRIRTKGNSVAFRLPVHLDTILEARAEAAGMTPRDYAAMVVERHLLTGTDAVVAAPVNTTIGKALAAEMLK